MKTETKNRIDMQNKGSVNERLINQVGSALASFEVQGRLFQFQSVQGHFGEIFEIFDRKNATKICQSYIKENIKKALKCIYILEQDKEKNNKYILEMKKAIKDIKNTIVWEIIIENGKLIKKRIGVYSNGKKH